MKMVSQLGHHDLLHDEETDKIESDILQWIIERLPTAPFFCSLIRPPEKGHIF